MSSSNASSVRVEPYAPAARADVGRVARRSGGFTRAEVAVCLSLLDEPDEYEVALARDASGSSVGFVIYGADPLAKGVWGIYWIATDRKVQRGGIGTALMRHVEERVRHRGRMILIETSGQPAYASQRAFYEKNGYVEAARIRDFYKPGDDLVVYRRDIEG
jgi:ribosomal protein S18 acetylase RimI-like enzyme